MFELVTAIGTRDWSEVVDRSWPADPRQLASVREQVRSWLMPLGLTESTRQDLVLAVSEAVDNAIERAQDCLGDGPTVDVTFWTEGGQVCVVIADNVAREPARNEPDWFSASLSGVMVRALVQSVHIRYDARGTRVRLRHPLDSDKS